MRAVRALALAALTIASGCAEDLSGWKVASTEHFRLYTDLRRGTYEPLIERLEDVHTGLTTAFFSVEIPPMEVFLFDESEFHSLLGPIGGLFVGGVGNEGVLVVNEGEDRTFLDQTPAHELTHAFIHATYRTPPVWFNEGFATYVESIDIRAHAVLFGSRHVGIIDEAAAGRVVSVDELFTAPASRFHGD